MGSMFGSEMTQNTKEWWRDFIANNYKAPNNRGLPPNITQDLLVRGSIFLIPAQYNM